MSEDESQLGLLQDLVEGRINVHEAIRRLEEPPVYRASKPRRSQSWWLVPLAAGMAFLGAGGTLGSLGGWWWSLAVPLLLLGTLLTVLASASSTSPWVLMRVRNRDSRPLQLWIPIPVRAAGWMIKIARPWAHGLDTTSIDELLLTLEAELASDRDLVIDVADVAGGEHVRVNFV
jgi:hypothetical protein